MAIITIEHQRGCGGRQIGRIVAERLNWRLVDRQVVRDVAQQLHIDEAAAEYHDERGQGLLDRAMALLQATGELTWMAPAGDTRMTLMDETIYHQTTTKVIEAAARNDRAVIVGHGAGFALANWPGVLRVGLYAPIERRVTTIMARRQVDRAEALRGATQTDHDRERYVRRFYQADWHAAEKYHLVINTGLYQPEQVAALILAAWQTSTLGTGQAAETKLEALPS